MAFPRASPAQTARRLRWEPDDTPEIINLAKAKTTHDAVTAALGVLPEVVIESATRLHIAWAEKLEEAFETVVIRALKRAMKPVTQQFTAVTAAAVEPEPEPGPPPGEPFVSPDDLAQVRTLWAAQVAEELLPLLDDTWRSGAQGVALAVGAVSPDAPDVLSVGAQEWLAGASNRLVRVGDQAWEEARSQLLEGFQAGESVPELAKRVRGVVTDVSARARTIARTEVIGASNAGSLAEAYARGLETKTWLNTHDARTRPTHVRAGEQTVPLDDRFQVGDALLRFPGDPLGPAGEVINCRCTVLFDEQPLCRCVPAWARRESGSLLAAAPPQCGCSERVEATAEFDGDAVALQEQAAAHRTDVEQNDWRIDDDDERHALQSARAAVNFYTNGSGYRELNGALRGGELTAEVSQQITALDDAFERLGVTLDRGVTLHRGVADRSLFAGHDEFVDLGYSSTSVARQTAETFAGRVGDTLVEGAGHLVEVRVPAGTRVLSGMSFEGELILPRGGRYRVVSSTDALTTLELVG